jgi:hypothetical protein
MWQRVKGKYHFLVNVDLMEDGRTAQTFCRDMVEVKRKNQVPYAMNDRCGYCSGVSHLINTSVADAMIYLKGERNLKVIRRAIELTKSVTLVKALKAKIRKLEKVSA